MNTKSVEWRSEPGLRVGAKVAFVAHFLGKRLAYTQKDLARLKAILE